MKTKFHIRFTHVLLFAVLAILVLTAASCSNTVPYGKIQAKRNLNYDQFTQPTTAKYTSYFYVGSNFDTIANDEQLVTLDAANIGPSQLGVYTTGYDANHVAVVEYLPEGVYSKIPAEFVRVVGAANIDGGHVGVYCNYTEGQETYLLLPPGVQPYPDYMVRQWPTGTRLYRTLGDNAWNAYKGGDPGPAGGADLVETKIDHADLANTDMDLTYTVDIEFTFDLRQINAKTLCDLGGSDKAIQLMIGTPIRGKGRLVTGQFGLDVEQPTKVADLEGVLMLMLQQENQGRPVTFGKVAIRSLEVGTAEYRALIEQNATALASEQSRGALLDQQLLNADKQNQLQMKLAQGLAQVMDLLECKGDWRCMWVWMFGSTHAPQFTGGELQEPPVPATP